ncbi:hypothetical protein KEH51_00720 [[Brevibacterium] frigoritolerans]|uniref:Uncharacterized protein n=1 Tax=Peribacillus frigoritolerans TaxID=450367 RepID=A0A941J9I7_9BACI|nr:hypothetical protein [Peribacillus frigoritolerans]
MRLLREKRVQGDPAGESRGGSPDRPRKASALRSKNLLQTKKSAVNGGLCLLFCRMILLINGKCY